MAKRFLAMGLSGPKWAYIFFIVSLAWACDETNFKLLLRKKIFKKKSEAFSQISGTWKNVTPPKNVFVLLSCNVMKQTLSWSPLSYHALYYISKRFCCYNIFHLFEKDETNFVLGSFELSCTVCKLYF